jgi:hypothetical protein
MFLPTKNLPFVTPCCKASSMPLYSLMYFFYPAFTIPLGISSIVILNEPFEEYSIP